jgi:hypothetical protein
MHALQGAPSQARHQSLVAQQPFAAAHKYQQAPVQAPFLAAAPPAPPLNLVCNCSSQAPRSAPNITFTYAGDRCYHRAGIAVQCTMVQQRGRGYERRHHFVPQWRFQFVFLPVNSSSPLWQ